MVSTVKNIMDTCERFNFIFVHFRGNVMEHLQHTVHHLHNCNGDVLAERQQKDYEATCCLCDVGENQNVWNCMQV